jgi:hypothetical protein
MSDLWTFDVDEGARIIDLSASAMVAACADLVQSAEPSPIPDRSPWLLFFTSLRRLPHRLMRPARRKQAGLSRAHKPA